MQLTGYGLKDSQVPQNSTPRYFGGLPALF